MFMALCNIPKHHCVVSLRLFEPADAPDFHSLWESPGSNHTSANQNGIIRTDIVNALHENEQTTHSCLNAQTPKLYSFLSFLVVKEN